MSGDYFPPVQERSKKTLERLLQATIKTIRDEGIEGITIVRIAAEAQMAPAGVYRRFKDKDALLRAAFQSALEKGGEAQSRLFDRSEFSKLTLEQAASEVVAALFRQYRGAPRFLKAFVQFYEGHADATFRSQALDQLLRNFQIFVDALSSCPEVAELPDSEFRVKFGTLTIASSIEAMLLAPDTIWTAIQPISDERSQAEFVQILVSSLRR